MASLFSYNTFSSVSAVLGEFMSASSFPDSVSKTAISPDIRSLHEGAQTRDSSANDQVLHLEGAFVGVESFRVCEEASDAVVNRDAVAAADLPGPRHRLAGFGRAKRFGDRRVSVRQLAFTGQLSHARHQALAGRNVLDHLGEEVLNQLERGDRLAELQPLLRVLERVLVRPHLAASRHPRNAVARYP